METVDKDNGVFFSGDSDIPKAIEKIEKTKWNHKRIRKSADRYDISVFSKKMKEIAKALQATG